MPTKHENASFPLKITKCDKPISVKKTAGAFTGGFPRQTEAKIHKPKAEGKHISSPCFYVGH